LPNTPPTIERTACIDISNASRHAACASHTRGDLQMNTHSSKQTTDHDEIRRWAESRDGHPASVRGTEDRGEDAGLLRIKFRDDEDLEEIGWEDFFEKFDEEKLAFLYQDETADGGKSRFFKFVQRH
jgi:hypothetical protein